MTPTEYLGAEQLIALSADLELQLEKGAGTRAMAYFLVQARNDAASAFDALVKVHPGNASEIQLLQNDIIRFEELVTWVRTMLVRGKETDFEITEDEREEIAALVNPPGADERLATQGHD